MKISFQNIKELLPTKTTLHYVDYRESLDGMTDSIQIGLNSNDWSSLYQAIDEAYIDDSYYIDEVKKELRNDLEKKYDIDKDEAQEILDEYEDELRDEIYERDDSDVFKDLLQNTTAFIAHYDTGYEVPEGSWQWSRRRVEYEKKQIKKHLGIHGINKWDDEIRKLIYNASYGGQINIYFELDLKEFMKRENVEENGAINFTGVVWIGIVDHGNGSGDVEDFHDINLKFAYNPNNVFLEESIKYNWTYSIAGMMRDWCASTKVTFTEDKLESIPDSHSTEMIAKEKRFQEVYRNGGCSFDDADISRHRITPYFNEPPFCRNECFKCGRTWID